MRITFVNTLYWPHGGSGAEVTLRFLAGRLAAKDHECTIVTLSPDNTERVGEIEGIPVHYLQLANLFWPHQAHRPRLLRPAFQALDAYNPLMRHRLGGVLARLRPDVVHCHNLLGFSVAAWAAAARRGIPVVQTLHDYNLACPRGTMWRPGRGNCARACAGCRLFAVPRRAASHLPHVVTGVSHRLLDRVTAAGTFRTARQLRVIRGNNPADALPPLPPPPPPGTPLRLGFLGRLDPAKGIELLIDAVAALPRGAATLAIAGRGPDGYAAALRARAGGHAAIGFCGQVEAGAFLQGIDLLVIPSVWEDPFPRVFHEALAHGVPSLVTPLGGLPEAIVPGRTGFVTAAATAAALRATLAEVQAGAAGLPAMRAACRAAAAAFAPTRIAAQYEAVLAAAAVGTPVPAWAGEAWPRAAPQYSP